MILKPAHISLLGLIADIIGVFLLSVEAIKLDNFRKLREKVMQPLDHNISYSSPKFKMIFAKDFLRQMKSPHSGPIKIKKEEANAFLEVFNHFYLTHYIGGFIATIAIVFMIHLFFVDINVFIHSKFGLSLNYLHYLIAFVVLLLIVLVNRILTNYYAYRFAATPLPLNMFAIITLLTPPSIVFMVVGELFHMLIALMDKLILSFLNYLERKTPDGTIGIIGFLMASIGFVLQFYGTWESP